MAMVVKFGKTRISVASVAEASAVYSAARDAAGLGASRWPCGVVTAQGKTIGHISYNGRVWAKPSKQWSVGDLPIYDNRT